MHCVGCNLAKHPWYLILHEVGDITNWINLMSLKRQTEGEVRYRRQEREMGRGRERERELEEDREGGRKRETCRGL